MSVIGASEGLAVKKVIVIGLDGLEPTIVETMLAAGELPNLRRLAAAEGFSRVANTTPAQTPAPPEGPVGPPVRLHSRSTPTPARGASSSARPGRRGSDWLRVRFKSGLLQSDRRLVRFHLVRTGPAFELYASPVNFDPEAPPFPISHPADYAAELYEALGPFHTTGMVEDHTGITNDRISESTFLD